MIISCLLKNNKNEYWHLKMQRARIMIPPRSALSLTSDKLFFIFFLALQESKHFGKIRFCVFLGMRPLCRLFQCYQEINIVNMILPPFLTAPILIDPSFTDLKVATDITNGIFSRINIKKTSKHCDQNQNKSYPRESLQLSPKYT